ncbi:single-stranded DNA-binding protein, partial [Psychromonas sp. SP041]|uniref:single-stranded DNA-binding protein n=1 Tax=Psychromonas sp. SP041 TaxID=1365007 RepID=UPI0010C7D441
MNINKQTVAGNLSADAVVRQAGERDVISFRVITNYEYLGLNGEKISKPTGHNVSRFAPRGKLNGLANLLKKGAGVYVTGRTVIEKKEEHLNIFVDATQGVSNQGTIEIFRYVTERPAQQQQYQQQAPAQHQQQAPAQYQQQAPAQYQQQAPAQYQQQAPAQYQQQAPAQQQQQAPAQYQQQAPAQQQQQAPAQQQQQAPAQQQQQAPAQQQQQAPAQQQQ